MGFGVAAHSDVSACSLNLHFNETTILNLQYKRQCSFGTVTKPAGGGGFHNPLDRRKTSNICKIVVGGNKSWIESKV